MAQLVFKRESQWISKFRKFDIYINDNKVEEIKDGEIIDIDKEPGEYVVKLKID